MDRVGRLVDDLRRNPSRFRDTGGYDRLIRALREGRAPDAVKQALCDGWGDPGNLLWTVCELENVGPFVSEARQHLSSPDKGTAAYAMEIVMRGGQESADLRAALDRLRVCHVAVCEHAVITLTGAGLTRLREILKAVGYTWSSALADRLSRPASQAEIEGLILDTARDRQVVGVVLASLAREQGVTVAGWLARSDEAWIRDYGEWLEQEF